MMIIGVDYHPSFQAIAFLMEETGECGEQELNHSDGQGSFGIVGRKRFGARVCGDDLGRMQERRERITQRRRGAEVPIRIGTSRF